MSRAGDGRKALFRSAHPVLTDYDGDQRGAVRLSGGPARCRIADTSQRSEPLSLWVFSTLLPKSELARALIPLTDTVARMHAIRYTILEIRYTRPPRITARDERSGRTVVFTWPVDVHPTQSELARIFSESTDSSDAGSLAENPSRCIAADRRRFSRICHSFEGRRRGILPVPIRIYDLSVGGCLIESRSPEARGRRLELDIDLPWEGWTTVDAEIVNVRPEYGYGVQFVRLPEAVRRRLDRVIERIGKTETNQRPQRSAEVLETTETGPR